MGNVARGFKKTVECLKECNSEQISFYEEQEAVKYSQEIGHKCLQHLIDLNYSSFDSLKRLGSYFHPALLDLRFLVKNEDPDNFLHVNQEDIVSSSGFILKMYMNFLEKVVPANISYFHFMREKDLYVHLSALRYVMEAGSINGMYQKKCHVFANLTTGVKQILLKLISHWLYDMVKYYCSVIYIESLTIPHLIITLSAVICGLLEDQEENLFENFETHQRILTYERTLYSFTHLLCLANKINSFTNLQMLLAATTRLISKINKDLSQTVSIGYAPSYWYVEEIGFVEEPHLEKICFLIVADLISHKVRDVEEQNKKQEKKMEERRRRRENKKRKYRSKDKGYENFADEDIPSVSEVSVPLDTLNLIKVEEKIIEMNNVTVLQAYNLLLTFLQYHPFFGKMRKFEQILEEQIQTLEEESLLRPFILRIIDLLLQSSGHIDKEDAFLTRPGWEQSKLKSCLKPNISNTLEQYHKNHRIDYHLENYIVPHGVVGSNIRLFLNKKFIEMTYKYDKQISKNEGEIWAQILKYNKHQFKAVER